MKHNKSVKKTYTESDYNSNDGMLTMIWGPSMWHSLHTISFNYPVKPTCYEKNQYRDFILNLKNVLPCGKCRANLCKNMKMLPLKMSDMKSRYTFSLYLYKLHELINTMLNKKSGLSFNDVRERYEHFRSRCVKSHKQMIKDKKLRKTMKHEKGCTDSLYGEKSKCVIQIVPQSTKCNTFQMDEKCIKKTLYEESKH